MPIWNGKGDVQYLGKCRGITLLSHVMKVLERILVWRIRKSGDGDQRRATGVLKGSGDDRWEVRAEAAGGEEVGDATWDGIWICAPEEGLQHCPKRDGDGDIEMDESARSRSQVGEMEL